MSAQTLTEFLLARISEDEAMAERRFNEWRDGGGVLDLALTPGPARVLAECEAKRRIVAEHEYVEADGGLGCGVCCIGFFSWGPEQMAGECPTLQALALPYADHPDYDESWR